MVNFIKDILIERDRYKYKSIHWHNLNQEKAFILEDLKSSWREKVAYFREEDIKHIPFGFSKTNQTPDVKMFEDKRSVLEYNGGHTRQIIPYCLVRYEDEYYFVLRKNNSDDRLNGLAGLLGGHVNSNILEGMLRELKEEANILSSNIANINLRGIIKIKKRVSYTPNYDVSIDHLGLVYEVELKHARIRLFENGVQTGTLVNVSDFYKYRDKFEDWLKLTTDNLFTI